MLLALNTCGDRGSVALGRVSAEEVRILGSGTLAMRTYSAQLIPQIAALLAGQSANMAVVEAIVVVNGPGSFTGIRVGLSSAQGLAEAAGTPLITVSRLALLAWASGLPHVLAAVAAGRGDYYVGEYRNGERLREVLLTGEETVMAATSAGAAVLVCDESSGASTSACAALAVCGPLYVQPPDAAEALRFAAERFRASRFENAAGLQANYLRRPDAEVVLAGRVPA